MIKGKGEVLVVVELGSPELAYASKPRGEVDEEWDLEGPADKRATTRKVITGDCEMEKVISSSWSPISSLGISYGNLKVSSVLWSRGLLHVFVAMD